MPEPLCRRRFLAAAAAVPASLWMPRRLLAAGGKPAMAGPINKACYVKHAFTPRPGEHPCVGLITKLTLGDHKAKTGFEVPNPENAGRDRRCVAVVESVAWDGTPGGKITFVACVPATLAEAAERFLKQPEPVETSVQFRIYEYDPDAKDYYRSFYSGDSDLLAKTSADDIDIDTSNDHEYEVDPPENYQFTIGLTPRAEAQELHVATSKTGKIVKQWGVAQE